MSEETIKIGLKPGSQNTCIAMRTPEGTISTKCIKTAIYYPRTLLQEQSAEPPLIGEEALLHAGALMPLNLGLVETEDGVQQIKDILTSLALPQDADMVLASPAMEINEGKNRLIHAVDEVCSPKSMFEFSEGVCSAAYILGNAEKLKDTTMLVANLGSSTFEFACIHEANTIHLTAHSDISGNNVDEKIRHRIQNSIGDAMITIKDVREIKETTSLKEPKTFKIKGQTRNGIVEQEINNEVLLPLTDYVERVCETIKHEIRTIKPELRKRALENPLIIAGGMANIDGLPESIEDTLSLMLNYPIKIAYSKSRDNHIAPAIGALMLAEALAKEQTGAH